MTTKTPNRAAVPASRNRPRPVVILDIVVAKVFGLFALIFMHGLAGFSAEWFIASRVTA